MRKKCISHGDADGRDQKTKTKQFCRYRPNKLINQKELQHDRPCPETSHTRYYAKLWLCCDIFSGSSTGVNELRLTTMTTFRFEVARVTMLNYTISARISQYIDLLTKYIICSENGKISFRYPRYPFDVSIHQTAITLPADAPRRASARPLPGSPAAFRS